jgi:hypothetical protein
MRYDVLKAPDPQDWLDLDEADRRNLSLEGGWRLRLHAGEHGAVLAGGTATRAGGDLHRRALDVAHPAVAAKYLNFAV